MKDHNKYFKPGQIILHIPHSSIYIPETFHPLFYLSEDELQEELLRMTDLYTDEIFRLSGVPESNRVVFPYSRLICDVERFRDDQLEVMAKTGMGVCYRTTSSLKPLKMVTAAHREEILALYDRHHAILKDITDSIVDSYGTGLLIDCHSFASMPLPYEAVIKDYKNKERKRPDICIGTDPGFHTPAWLRDFLIKGFEGYGYSVVVDDPFNGTMVPISFYHKDRRLLSVMVELNRNLYLDEKTGRRKETFNIIQADIERVISFLYA